MFTGCIEDVANTRLLISKVYASKIINTVDKSGKARKFKRATGEPLQLTIYSNAVSMYHNPDSQYADNPDDGYDYPKTDKSRTAMIIPFPIRSDRSNRFKLFSFGNYGSVFDDIELLFDTKPSNTSDQQFSTSGNYIITVIKSIAGFDAINPDLFTLGNQAKSIIKQYYSTGFGFILAILKHNAQYKPFGYCHELLANGKLFIPIRHCILDDDVRYIDKQFGKYHEPQIVKVDSDLSELYHDTLLSEDRWLRHQISRKNLETTRQKTELKWDHVIYVVNQPLQLEKYNCVGMKCNTTNIEKMREVYSYLNINLFPEIITFGGIKSIHRISLDNRNAKNSDIYI